MKGSLLERSGNDDKRNVTIVSSRTHGQSRVRCAFCANCNRDRRSRTVFGRTVNALSTKAFWLEELSTTNVLSRLKRKCPGKILQSRHSSPVGFGVIMKLECRRRSPKRSSAAIYTYVGLVITWIFNPVMYRDLPPFCACVCNLSQALFPV